MQWRKAPSSSLTSSASTQTANCGTSLKNSCLKDSSSTVSSRSQGTSFRSAPGSAPAWAPRWLATSRSWWCRLFSRSTTSLSLKARRPFSRKAKSHFPGIALSWCSQSVSSKKSNSRKYFGNFFFEWFANCKREKNTTMKNWTRNLISREKRLCKSNGIS